MLCSTRGKWARNHNSGVFNASLSRFGWRPFYSFWIITSCAGRSCCFLTGTSVDARPLKKYLHRKINRSFLAFDLRSEQKFLKCNVKRKSPCNGFLRLKSVMGLADSQLPGDTSGHQGLSLTLARVSRSGDKPLFASRVETLSRLQWSSCL